MCVTDFDTFSYPHTDNPNTLLNVRIAPVMDGQFTSMEEPPSFSVFFREFDVDMLLRKLLCQVAENTTSSENN